MTQDSITFKCEQCHKDNLTSQRAQLPGDADAICLNCHHINNVLEIGETQGKAICPACGAHYDSSHPIPPALCAVNHN